MSSYKQYLLLFIIGLIVGAKMPLNAQILSENSTISILTYGPLEEVYLHFGHSALRIQDPQKNMDILYNYGMFDFGQPNFIGNFLQGKLLYSLGVQQYQPVLNYNRSRDRHFTEQVLNLTLAEKNEIYGLLRENYRPENRDYYYDFYFDNCATRLWEIIGETLKDKLIYDKQQIDKGKTFRQLLEEYIEHNPWLDFGIDLILGTSNDVKSGFKGQLFLPDYLEKSLNNSTINRDSTTVKLVATTNVLHQTSKPKPQPSFWTAPLFLFGLLCLVFLGCTFLRIDNLPVRLLDGLFFTVLAIIGLIISFMWWGTEHETTKNNWNLLWTLPTQLWLAIAIFRNKIGDYTKWYFLLTALIAAIILLTFPIFPQQLHIAFIPILLIVMFRGLWYSGYLPFFSRD